MIISWLGDAGIRLQTKDAVLVIDPPSSETGFRTPKQATDIVAVTQRDGRDPKAVGGEPMILETPGEYERKNVFVYGLAIPSEPHHVHWRVEAEDMSFGHLGNLQHILENGELSQLEGVDVLFVPVGGNAVLTPSRATELISQIEPRVVIPIQYKTGGGTASYGTLEAWLKDMGAKPTEPQAKWKIQKKDLPADETQVVVLTLE